MSATAVQAMIAEGIATIAFPDPQPGLNDPVQMWQVPAAYAALIECVYIFADFNGAQAVDQTFVLSFHAQDGKRIWAYPAPQGTGNGTPTNYIYTWFRGATDTVQLAGWLPGEDEANFSPGVAGPPLPNFYLPPLSTIQVAQYAEGTPIPSTLTEMAVVYTPLNASDSGVTVVSAGIPLLTPVDG